MIYFLYFIFIFTFIQLIISIINLIFNQKLFHKSIEQKCLVSVLIPARNEEKNIANILSDLLNQEYKNIEIIVFDDASEDNTVGIVEGFANTNSKIKLIKSVNLPAGWIGKNYACSQLSEKAEGKYLLFIDADVRVQKDIISKSLYFMKKHDLGLLSIFPKQIMISIGEKLTVPLMNYILLSLLPLFLVRKSSFISLSAANGQFMLFNNEIYKKLEPHKIFKNEKAEDIKISRFFKRKKIKIACLSGNKEISCRMYSGYNEAVNGFAKNIIMFFGGSFLFAILFFLITTLGFIIVLFFSNILAFILYIFMFLLTKIFISIVSKQSIFENLLYCLPQHFSMGVVIVKSINNKLKRNYIWKGRNI